MRTDSGCDAIDRPDLVNNDRFITQEDRSKNSAELVPIIEQRFQTGTYDQWVDILSRNKLIWSPVKTPLEVTRDEQAIANEFFADWDHPVYGRIRMLNNPIKLSKTPAENRCKAPDLGEHTDQILAELGYSQSDIDRMRREGVI